MRKVSFAKGELYHIYNRGVDKRDIFKDKGDIERFFQGMVEFNGLDPIGSIHENSFKRRSSKPSLGSSTSKLVKLACYCLNTNHYHFVLEQIEEGGIVKFMQRLGTGYTKYFNTKYKRSGSLFQGRYKSKHIDSDEYLLHLSAYINLNDRSHSLGSSTSKLSKSSWAEYVGEADEHFCDKDIILGLFNNSMEYREFAENSLIDILERKEEERSMLKDLM